MGEAFRRAVTAFAKGHDVPVLHFGRRDRQIDKVRPYFAAGTEPGVVAVTASTACAVWRRRGW